MKLKDNFGESGTIYLCVTKQFSIASICAQSLEAMEKTVFSHIWLTADKVLHVLTFIIFDPYFQCISHHNRSLNSFYLTPSSKHPSLPQLPPFPPLIELHQRYWIAFLSTGMSMHEYCSLCVCVYVCA